jgi:hypothetical protein
MEDVINIQNIPKMSTFILRYWVHKSFAVLESTYPLQKCVDSKSGPSDMIHSTSSRGKPTHYMSCRASASVPSVWNGLLGDHVTGPYVLPTCFICKHCFTTNVPGCICTLRCLQLKWRSVLRSCAVILVWAGRPWHAWNFNYINSKHSVHDC